MQHTYNFQQDVINRATEKLANIKKVADINKEARKSRIGKLIRALKLQPNEGVYSHAFGNASYANAGATWDEVLDIAKRYKNPHTGKYTAKAPAALAANNVPVRAEVSNVCRKDLTSSLSDLLPGSTLSKDTNSVTVPYRDMWGESVPYSVKYKNGRIFDELTFNKFSPASYEYDEFIPNRKIDKFLDKFKTGYTVSLEDRPSGLYGNVGLMIPDHGIAKGHKAKILRTEFENPSPNGSPEFVISPILDEANNLVTGFAEGIPYYLVKDKAPDAAERGFIRKFKQQHPTAVAVKARDFDYINKRLLKNDIRVSRPKRVRGQQFDYAEAKRLAKEFIKEDRNLGEI